MWSLDYVQVPKEEAVPVPEEAEKEKLEDIPNNQDQKDEPAETETRQSRIQSLVQQMSMSAEYKTIEEGPIAKSPSESSLSEDGKEGKDEGIK